MRVLCLFQKFSFKASTIYLDLVNEREASGHEVYIIAGSSDADINYKKIHYDGHKRTAYVKLPDQFHADKIRKGLIQLTIGRKMLSVARKFFWKEKIDLIIYPTPPITLAGIISPLKRHYGATAYLMLKDIFPQNAVDLKMMNEGGFLHKYFRKMEKIIKYKSYKRLHKKKEEEYVPKKIIIDRKFSINEKLMDDFIHIYQNKLKIWKKEEKEKEIQEKSKEIEEENNYKFLLSLDRKKRKKETQ